MRTNKQLIQDISEEEVSSNLDDFEIYDIPLWRMIRFQVRLSYLKTKTNFTNKSVPLKINLVQVLKWFAISMIEILKLLLSRKHNTTCFFAFPRLENRNGIYFDKFTDPLINSYQFSGDVIILQRSLGGNYLSPRRNENLVYKTDALLYFSKFISLVLFPVILFLNIKTIRDFELKVQKIYGSEIKIKRSISNALTATKLSVIFYKLIFRVSNVKRIFVVNKDIFISQIIAAKQLGITVYEFQHGATSGPTALYTGSYNSKVDPDYFLTFGSFWVNKHFGVPHNRILNLGWAYKQEQTSDTNIVDHRILCISSPSITSKILDIVVKLARLYRLYSFILRLHPQEQLTASQSKRIATLQNVKVETVNFNLNESLSLTTTVIGDKSTVLFEALSLDKQVLLLNLDELKRTYSKEEKELFTIVNNYKDFETLLSHKDDKGSKSNDIYSNFDKSLFKDILND